jgi:hypothetical protein
MTTRQLNRACHAAASLAHVASVAELFHTADRKAYANIPNGGHREPLPVRSKDFKLWLTREQFQRVGKPPSRDALNSALDFIDARAQFDGREERVFVRVGGLNGKIYLDLCDKNWRAVEIDADGWRIIDNPPVRFRRPPGIEMLPPPAAGGSVDMLRPIINVKSDEDFALAVAWLLAALRDRGPYPVLVLSGEQGSAKTFFTKVLRLLVDPNTAPNRTLPRDERDLYIAANNGQVIAFDNVSGMPFWISDALCRLSTGGGFATRQLYTDDDEILFAVTRPVILNGIEDSVTRPDLVDRSIILTLEPIAEDARRSESDLETEFEAARPKILGALLDTVSTGLRMLPQIALEVLPRMADFALWVAACETGLWEEGTFEAAYAENRERGRNRA